jgi:hypothetical protein
VRRIGRVPSRRTRNLSSLIRGGHISVRMGACSIGARRAGGQLPDRAGANGARDCVARREIAAVWSTRRSCLGRNKPGSGRPVGSQQVVAANQPPSLSACLLHRAFPCSSDVRRLRG